MNSQSNSQIGSRKQCDIDEKTIALPLEIF